MKTNWDNSFKVLLVFFELSADLYKSIKSFSQSKNNTGSYWKYDADDE